MSLTPEAIKRIKQIEIRTRRLIKEAFAGAYHSVFKGRGIMFDGVRPYQPGDDIRDIEWNITAREDGAYIKQYVEERELNVMIVLDGSSSALFGTAGQNKHSLAVDIGATLTLTAIANNDKVGLMIFGDTIESYTPPRKGRNHTLGIIRDLLAERPRNTGTNIGLALESVNRLMKQRGIIFFISDFLAAPEEYERQLLVTSRRHDLVAIMLSDPLETRWTEDVGLVHVHDAETGQTQIIDTSSRRWREQFRRQTARFNETTAALLNKAGVDRINISVEDDYIAALMHFFKKRARNIS